MWAVKTHLVRMPIFLLFLLIPILALAESFTAAPLEQDPLVQVEGYVNASTGDFILQNEDFLVSGIEPISIQRAYISSEGKETSGGWELVPHKQLLFLGEKDRGGVKHFLAKVYEPNGTFLTYRRHVRKGFVLNPHLGIANTAHGEMCRKHHLIRQRMIEKDPSTIIISTLDGTERIYKQSHISELNIVFLLQSEHLANGHYRLYQYDNEHRISSIKTTNGAQSKVYAWCEFHYVGNSKANPDFEVVTSDGQKALYHFSQMGTLKNGEPLFVLTSLQGNRLLAETFHYTAPENSAPVFLDKRSFPEGRSIQVEYYPMNDPSPFCAGKVKTLYLPLGKKGELVATHRFHYELFKEGKNTHSHHLVNGKTEVVKADKSKIVYHFSRSFYPLLVEYFDDKQLLHHAFEMEWNSQGELLKKNLLNEKKELVWSRSYVYDEQGNKLKEHFTGCLSAAGQVETSTTLYKYDPLHRLIRQEEPNGKVTQFSYWKQTELPASILLGDKNKVWQRTFYKYTEEGALLQTITDDGTENRPEDLSHVRLRKIVERESDSQGRSTHVVEKALDKSTERLLQQTFYFYEENSIRKEIYDTSGKFSSSTENRYDTKNRLIQSLNPLGEITEYQYDENNNKIWESLPGIEERYFSYDSLNRLIEEKQDTIHTCYAYEGNTLLQTDFLGNITTKTFDPFGHVVEERLPFVLNEQGQAKQPTIVRHYDCMGNEVETIDPLGHRTIKSYTALGQLTRILYPNGTEDSFEYSRGTIKSHTNPEGTKIEYQKDLLGRTVLKQTFNKQGTLLLEEKATFNSSHLLSKIDPSGKTTLFFYDYAGRVEKEQIFTGESLLVETQFFYDNAGRLEKTLSEGTLTLLAYDLLDRVVEKKIETEKGDLISHHAYTFAKCGKLESTTRYLSEGKSTETDLYDRLGRLSLHMDPLGKETRYFYGIEEEGPGHQIYKKVTMHPDGIHIHELFDPLGRLISKESLSPTNASLSISRYAYLLPRIAHHLSSTGDLVQEMKSPLAFQEPEEISYDYDSMGNVVTKLDRRGQISYTYTPLNQVKTISYITGIRVHHLYDPLGRLIELKSSDGTVHYAIHYNLADQPVEIMDYIQKRTERRTYTAQGNLQEETLLNGQTIKSSYDAKGRRTQLILPDETQINYRFGPFFLEEIHRKNLKKEFEYRHRIVKVDLAHFPTEQRLSDGFGGISFSLDNAMRIVSFSTPHLTQTITSFDATDRPTSMAMGNTVQLLDPEDVPSQKKSKPFSLTYDALGRLIQIEKPEQILSFTYDLWNRQMTKKVTEYIQGEWTVTTSLAFLYKEEQEIGAIDLLEEDSLCQLRVCADDLLNTGDQAIAYELEGKLYIPIHDLFGNTLGLLSSIRRNLIETYAFTPYGEETIIDSWGDKIPSSKAKNPWRFSSGRTDEETGLVFLQGRYYDPTLGSFLTPPFGDSGLKGSDYLQHKQTSPRPSHENRYSPLRLFQLPRE